MPGAKILTLLDNEAASRIEIHAWRLMHNSNFGRGRMTGSEPGVRLFPPSQLFWRYQLYFDEVLLERHNGIHLPCGIRKEKWTFSGGPAVTVHGADALGTPNDTRVGTAPHHQRGRACRHAFR
jgi:hypothetical protein